MSLVFKETARQSAGSEIKLEGRVAFDSSYPTGGESFTAAQFGLTKINRVLLQSEGGYDFETDYTNSKIKAFNGGSGTSGATSGGTPAAQVFTGSSSALNLATPAFSGTGYATAGQVVTTTGNQTMALNQCAGMWLIADALSTTPPVLIISNTAVTGAPAVLTVIGVAPVTDAGTYKIVSTIPVGTNGASAALATHTHTVAAAAGIEVANATDLSGLTAVEYEIYGY